MIKFNNLTYFDLDELTIELKEYDYTKEEIISFIKEGKLIGEVLDNNWYVNKYDLNFFITCLKRPKLFEQTKYLGAIGVDLSQLSLTGKILDIGGGGEGFIGQIMGEEVIAIDPQKEELVEAPNGPIKITWTQRSYYSLIILLRWLLHFLRSCILQIQITSKSLKKFTEY